MTSDILRVYRDGRPRNLASVTVGGTTVVIDGSPLRIATTRHQLFDVVDAPDQICAVLRHERLADIFTFTQLLPDTTPKYDYPMEWVAISALPISSWEHWFTHQIRTADRKEIKKAAKRGLEIRHIPFTDELVSGITEIFNETPIRQGRPFWHYGKTFDEVKVEAGQDLDRSHFIGAYFNGELIGFHKLIAGRCFVVPVLCVSSVKHRDKLTDSALISAAVRFCADGAVPYLLYGDWRMGSHRHFLERHGFTKILMPRYYIALTARGSICLKLRIHKGWKGFVKGLLPEAIVLDVVTRRSRWYQWRLGTSNGEADSGADVARQRRDSGVA
jgi:hypothetical protein